MIESKLPKKSYSLLFYRRFFIGLFAVVLLLALGWTYYSSNLSLRREVSSSFQKDFSLISLMLEKQLSIELSNILVQTQSDLVILVQGQKTIQALSSPLYPEYEKVEFTLHLQKSPDAFPLNLFSPFFFAKHQFMIQGNSVPYHLLLLKNADRFAHLHNQWILSSSLLLFLFLFLAGILGFFYRKFVHSPLEQLIHELILLSNSRELVSLERSHIEEYNILSQEIETLLHRNYLLQQEHGKFKSRKEALYQLIPDLILFVNAEGVVSHYKKSHGKSVLGSRNDWEGAHFSSIFPEMAVGEARHKFSVTLGTGKMQTFEYEVKKKNKGLGFQARFIRTSQSEVIFLIQDISEQRYDSFALREAKQKALEQAAQLTIFTHQLEKQNQELHEAQQIAELANQTKSLFLANVSHEIRTPMNGIMGLTDFLLETELNRDQQEMLKMIKSSSTSLLSIINDILDLSKIEAGKLKIQSVSFNPYETVEKSIQQIAHPGYEKGLEVISFFEEKVPYVLQGDPDRLKQILVNLVGNAIKFTSQGEIIIRTKIAQIQREGIFLHFSIQDTGIGIPEDRQQAIFESFTQADDSTTRKHGGTGLGITISKQLVELMGGEMWLESKEKVGSTFHFTCQFQLPQKKEEVLGSFFSQQLIKERALIAVENQQASFFLSQTLQQFGLVTEESSEKQEILQRILEASHPIKILILDGNREAFFQPLLDKIKDIPLSEQPSLLLLLPPGNFSSPQTEEFKLFDKLHKPLQYNELFQKMQEALPYTISSQPKSFSIAETPKEEFPHFLASPSPLHILVAEDNPVNQIFTAKILEKLGFTYVLVNNGKEALESYYKEKFDLVLMDIQMPEMGGFEATHAIRAIQEEPIPIIAVTARAMAGDREVCLNEGMDEYISKPINGKTLYEVIQSVISETKIGGYIEG